jgi:pimeloyl-ACP methyl ester carboxylesterase
MKRVIILAAAVVLLACAALAAYAWLSITSRTPGAFLDAGGVRVHYTDEGAGEPVILVHGFAVQADLNWRRNGIIDALRKHFRVIALDLRGHGLSGKPHDPDDYGAEMAEDIVRLMDHLGIEKAHVVGYSLGGFLTLKLATMHPDRLITACPLGAGWERRENSTVLDAIEPLARRLDEGKGVAPPSGQVGAGRQKPDFIHTQTVRMLTRFFNDGRALAAVLRSLPELEVTEEELRAIPVPVLSIVGTRDPLVTGVDQMEGRIADHEIVRIQDATHMNVTRTVKLREALVRFLRAHNLPAAT